MPQRAASPPGLAGGLRPKRQKEATAMNWTKKEQNFLKDLQSEEKICIEKYDRAAESA